MKKYLPFILVSFFIGCKEPRNNIEKLKNKKPVNISLSNIDSLEIDRLKVKNKLNLNIIHFKGYDLGWSRYVANFDEKSEEIKRLYEKLSFKDIVSMYTFESMKRDTIYSFPFTDKVYKNQFSKKFDSKYIVKEPIEVFARIYEDKKLGKIIVIDSLK